MTRVFCGCLVFLKTVPKLMFFCASSMIDLQMFAVTRSSRGGMLTSGVSDTLASSSLLYSISLIEMVPLIFFSLPCSQRRFAEDGRKTAYIIHSSPGKRCKNLPERGTNRPSFKARITPYERTHTLQYGEQTIRCSWNHDKSAPLKRFSWELIYCSSPLDDDGSGRLAVYDSLLVSEIKSLDVGLEPSSTSLSEMSLAL